MGRCSSDASGVRVVSRYSFLTAYLADPAPQNTRDHGRSAPATMGSAAAHAPQRTASAATQNTRHSSPTPAAQEERAFILDAVQSGIGGVSITGTNLHATLLTWDGATIDYPEPSRPEPIDTVTRITLNTNCTVLSIPPRALAQLRSLVVGGENLILANTSLGFTRTLDRGALVLSESGYATLAIAIIG